VTTTRVTDFVFKLPMTASTRRGDLSMATNLTSAALPRNQCKFELAASHFHSGSREKSRPCQHLHPDAGLSL
jgi:hypothetical protein